MLTTMIDCKLQWYQINVIEMYKFKLPKVQFTSIFQLWVNENFSVEKLLKFIYYNENLPLLCEFTNMFWKTTLTITGVLYYLNTPVMLFYRLNVSWVRRFCLLVVWSAQDTKCVKSLLNKLNSCLEFWRFCVMFWHGTTFPSFCSDQLEIYMGRTLDTCNFSGQWTSWWLIK